MSLAPGEAALPPSLDDYNARVQGRDIRSGGGRPLRFVPADDDPEAYELRIFHRGEVPTRVHNWHDAFNAEVWLEYPLAKAALNRRHVAAQAELAALGQRERGRVRDRLTQFDECGVLAAGIPHDIWQALIAHRWREVFVERRAELLATTRFMLFGHASRDALRAPFIGLCGKLMRLDANGVDQAAADAELARRLASAEFLAPLPPLPLLGIPGLCADNEDPAYYEDARQFRPPRTMSAGSSPDSR